MKVVFIASYGPRKCGIATFTENKLIGMGCKSGRAEHEGFVVALNDPNNGYDYPEEVEFVIQQENAADYIAAAAYINESGADICILEHEFGIFGGRDGSYILSLLHRLNIPIISVFHTVLNAPSHNQKDITREIALVSAKSVVMSEKAVEFLTQRYGISPQKISVIHHGIPDFEFDRNLMKDELGFTGKDLLLTFGLIGRSKGIETAIRALPSVVKVHPETLYLILGKTHPNILKHSGEEYRDYLLTLATELGVANNIKFVDEFMDEERLSRYLSAADIYITPYLNEAQITSGTLAYAAGAGCAVVSTPYWHAAELLTEERGRLFNFNDNEQLSEILTDLLDRPELLRSLQQNARAYGREVTWPKIGDKYLSLATELINKYDLRQSEKEARLTEAQMPAFSLDHIRRMTDDTGLLQHAKFGIPNFKEGYCLDDNGRALMMAVMAYRYEKHLHTLDLLPVYLSYIHYMQNEDGSFRNFLSYSREFLDEVGSEDSFGRTIWALGYLMCYPTTEMHYRSGKEIFLTAAPNFEKLKHPRAIANTLIGICLYLQAHPDDVSLKRTVRVLSARLVNAYRKHSCESWKWFDHKLTYDNAVLPLCLLHAGETLKDDAILQTGMEAMDFLADICFKNGYLSVVGNEKWFEKSGEHSVFAQQPIDAMMMVLMFQKAFELSGDERYLDRLHKSFMWFLGKNDMRLHLYDRETKGCCDGLESYGVNRNQGAESTLAYLISYLTVNGLASEMKNAETASENEMATNYSATSIAV